jgi:branched-chain amino acid transport system substrate-binding protein
MRRTHRTLLGLAAVLALLLAACGGGQQGQGGQAPPQGQAAQGEPITVGIVTTTSGLLGSYGQQYIAGLEAGLDYATGGTRAVNGRPIEFEIVDDGGKPEQAIAAATDLVGRGVKIIAGTASSGIAVQMAPFAEENQILYIAGPAASDAITGINRYTFRSGRQTYQDVATASTLVGNPAGKRVIVLAQDSEFGAGNFAAVQSVLGGQGATVESLLVPLSATEFTPVAQQIMQARPDLLFVAWAGETTAAMWQALQQQGVFEATTVTTGLGDQKSWASYGQNPAGIEFLAHYFADAPDNEVNAFLRGKVGQADIFTPDGFVTAQMIVHGLTKGGPDDVDSMITALEGWTFDAPKGPQQIRASDHAMLQPMFTASLTGDAGNRQATLRDTLDMQRVAPPEKQS